MTILPTTAASQSAASAAAAAPATSSSASSNSNSSGRQIPIVCPGHTRPLAEVQFCSFVEDEDDNNNGRQHHRRTLLASACHDKLPMLRDATTGDWIGTFSGHKGAVWSTRSDPSASLVATASGDFTVKVWDAITGEELYNFPHDHVVKTVDWSADSKWLATGGHEGILRIFDIENPENEPRKFAIPPSVSGGGGSDAKMEKRVSISKVNWLDDSTVLAAGEDGIIRVWKVVTSDEDDEENNNQQQQPIHSLQVMDDGGKSSGSSGIRDMELVTVSSTQQTILTVAAGQRVSFYDMSTFQLLHSYTMPIHFREEGGASLHPITGSKFVVGGGRKGGSMASGSSNSGSGGGGGGELGSDLIVYVYDFHTGQMLEKYKGHHGPIRCVRYHPDGKSYATGSEDGTIRIWKTDP